MLSPKILRSAHQTQTVARSSGSPRTLPKCLQEATKVYHQVEQNCPMIHFPTPYLTMLEQGLERTGLPVLIRQARYGWRGLLRKFPTRPKDCFSKLLAPDAEVATYTNYKMHTEPRSNIRAHRSNVLELHTKLLRCFPRIRRGQ